MPTRKSAAKPAETTKRATPKTAARPAPKASIRRFDVFAEYNRLKAQREGMPAAQAKGHGLWLAKIVASRKFRGTEPEPKSEAERRKQQAAEERGGKWKTLGGEEQTDRLFDKQIVERMGRTFYRRVFSPAIRAALGRGASYESIRDTIRRDWQPAE